MGAGADLAFVGDDEVEDGEEGLGALAVPPVGLGRGIIPDLAGFVEIVIFL